MATQTDEELFTVLTVNAETGETNQRKLNDEDLAQQKIDVAAAESYQAEQNAKEKAKASALAKLKKLGLTVEEIAAL
jgi:hypothetical protein